MKARVLINAFDPDLAGSSTLRRRCQSARIFGFGIRRFGRGNNPGAISVPFYAFSVLCVP